MSIFFLFAWFHSDGRERSKRKRKRKMRMESWETCGWIHEISAFCDDAREFPPGCLGRNQYVHRRRRSAHDMPKISTFNRIGLDIIRSAVSPTPRRIHNHKHRKHRHRYSSHSLSLPSNPPVLSSHPRPDIVIAYRTWCSAFPQFDVIFNTHTSRASVAVNSQQSSCDRARDRYVRKWRWR